MIGKKKLHASILESDRLDCRRYRSEESEAGCVSVRSRRALAAP
jgi:hypothetical protein